MMTSSHYESSHNTPPDANNHCINADPFPPNFTWLMLTFINGTRLLSR